MKTDKIRNWLSWLLKNIQVLYLPGLQRFANCLRETEDPTAIVRAKTLLPLAIRQNQEFLDWREQRLTAYYYQQCYGEPSTDERRDAFLANAGNERYTHNGLPGHAYYAKKILPVVAGLAKTPEEFERVNKDAIAVMEILLRAEFSYTANRTSPRLMQEFFSDSEPNGGWRSARGQFKHFYTYGKKEDEQDTPQERENRKWLTMAIAIFQSWESDRYYGGGDYTNSTHEIERRFIPVYESIPLEYRDKAFRGFVNYGGECHSTKFLELAQKAIEYFKEKDGEKYLEYFFDLAQMAPDFHIGGRVIGYDDGVSPESFPVTSAEDSFEECKAIDELTKFKEELIELAKFMISKRHYDDGGRYTPSFLGNKNVEHYDYLSGFVVSLPNVVEKLEASGLNEEEITRILNFPKTYPTLPREIVILLVTEYTAINRNFLGGVSALLEYIEEIKVSAKCVRNLVSSLAQEECLLPKKNFVEYLETGAKVAKQLGNNGACYFDGTRLSGNSDFHDLAEKDFKEFEKLVDEIILFVSQMHKGVDVSLRKYFVKIYVAKFGKPNFNEFKKFLTVIRDGLVEMRRSAKDNIEMFVQCLCQISSSSRGLSGEEVNENRWNNPFPSDLDYEFLGNFLLHFIGAEMRVDTYSAMNDYLTVVAGGMDYRAAAIVQMEKNGLRVTNGTEIPAQISTEKLTKVASLVARVNEAIRSVHAICVQYRGNDESALSPEAFSSSTDALSNLHALDRDVVDMEEDPELKEIVDCQHVKRQINSAVSEAAFKRMLTLSINADVGEDSAINIRGGELYQRTNPSTKMILTCTALLASMGLIPAPRQVRNRIKTVNLLPGLQGPQAQIETFDRLVREHKDDIARSMEMVLPHLEKAVLSARMDIPGIFPVGGKIHTRHPMDDAGIRFLANTFGIDSTLFTLQHANTSLCLPPQISSLEMKMFIGILEILGLIDKDFPDLQTTMAGRWDENLAAQVGTSMLLATQRGVIYKNGAFRSKCHDDATGAHIMAYDAGVLSRDFPTHPKVIEEGRTDMFGRHSIGDIDLYQVLGTMATSQQYDIGFQKTAERFSTHLGRILQKHDSSTGIIGTMSRANWIFDNQKEGDLPEHEAMVNAISGIWMDHSGRPNYGIIGEIQQLVEWAKNEMRAYARETTEGKREMTEAIKTF